jgi:hypothetical protein
MSANPVSGEPPEGIYVASKVRWAPRWRQLRAEGLPIISTWIDEAGAGETGDWADLWCRCLAEVARCHVLILYADESERLKGALVEVGAALALGKPVIVFGSQRWTWEAHPDVARADNEADAIKKAEWLAALLRPAATEGGETDGREVSFADLSQAELVRRLVAAERALTWYANPTHWKDDDWGVG